MPIHPPTMGTDIQDFHMISLLGTARQAAHNELFISLLDTKEPPKTVAGTSMGIYIIPS